MICDLEITGMTRGEEFSVDNVQMEGNDVRQGE